MECVHDYLHLDTDFIIETGGYDNTYIRLDRFYCKKCLHLEEKRKSESSRGKPTWWRNKEW